MAHGARHFYLLRFWLDKNFSQFSEHSLLLLANVLLPPLDVSRLVPSLSLDPSDALLGSKERKNLLLNTFPPRGRKLHDHLHVSL
ncbi:hypothetical protein TNIN_448411 [Trichonephila inaurata madagascariensis]|uniref:Uncharacterized protein n=1 Tax=Trichonephila inaurata madagascariensis TaxID=2747483 RepID=A0A8X6X2G7_9ARAC|nr:hypothetical protein TNIN_448411 [Trichonephila inaurata madagascariensis]